jgi:hypothetical protein
VTLYNQSAVGLSGTMLRRDRRDPYNINHWGGDP